MHLRNCKYAQPLSSGAAATKGRAASISQGCSSAYWRTAGRWLPLCLPASPVAVMLGQRPSSLSSAVESALPALLTLIINHLHEYFIKANFANMAGTIWMTPFAGGL